MAAATAALRVVALLIAVAESAGRPAVSRAGAAVSAPGPSPTRRR